MNLFELKNHVVTFSPQALLLAPFKVLWQRDKSKSKEVAVEELAYIWYMEDHRSDFFVIFDEEERATDIKTLINLPKGWKEDKEVKEARKFYSEKSSSIAVKMLKNSITLISKINKLLGELDPSETYIDRQGVEKYKHDIKKMVETLDKVPDVLESLDKTYKQVQKQLEEDSGMRGSKVKSEFEEGI